MDKYSYAINLWYYACEYIKILIINYYTFSGFLCTYQWQNSVCCIDISHVIFTLNIVKSLMYCLMNIIYFANGSKIKIRSYVYWRGIRTWKTHFGRWQSEWNLSQWLHLSGKAEWHNVSESREKMNGVLGHDSAQ